MFASNEFSLGEHSNNLLIEFKQSICELNDLKYTNDYGKKDDPVLPFDLLVKLEEIIKYHSQVIQGRITFNKAFQEAKKTLEITIQMHKVVSWSMMFSDAKRFVVSDDFDSDPYVNRSESGEKLEFQSVAATQYAHEVLKKDHEKAGLNLPRIEVVAFNSLGNIIPWRSFTFN